MAEARRRVLARDEGSVEAVIDAFNHKNNNIVNWQQKPPFIDWVRENPDEALSAMREIWADEDEHCQPACESLLISSREP